MNNIENLKNKGGEYIFLAVFVAIIAYSFGEAVGRDNTKASFLDSAYIYLIVMIVVKFVI